MYIVYRKKERIWLTCLNVAELTKNLMTEKMLQLHKVTAKAQVAHNRYRLLRR
jgi:hypothetical protein